MAKTFGNLTLLETNEWPFAEVYLKNENEIQEIQGRTGNFFRKISNGYGKMRVVVIQGKPLTPEQVKNQEVGPENICILWWYPGDEEAKKFREKSKQKHTNYEFIFALRIEQGDTKYYAPYNLQRHAKRLHAPLFDVNDIELRKQMNEATEGSELYNPPMKTLHMKWMDDKGEEHIIKISVPTVCPRFWELLRLNTPPVTTMRQSKKNVAKSKAEKHAQEKSIKASKSSAKKKSKSTKKKEKEPKTDELSQTLKRLTPTHKKKNKTKVVVESDNESSDSDSSASSDDDDSDDSSASEDSDNEDMEDVDQNSDEEDTKLLMALPEDDEEALDDDVETIQNAITKIPVAMVSNRQKITGGIKNPADIPLEALHPSWERFHKDATPMTFDIPPLTDVNLASKDIGAITDGISGGTQDFKKICTNATSVPTNFRLVRSTKTILDDGSRTKDETLISHDTQKLSTMCGPMNTFLDVLSTLYVVQANMAVELRSTPVDERLTAIHAHLKERDPSKGLLELSKVPMAQTIKRYMSSDPAFISSISLFFELYAKFLHPINQFMLELYTKAEAERIRLEKQSSQDAEAVSAKNAELATAQKKCKKLQSENAQLKEELAAASSKKHKEKKKKKSKSKKKEQAAPQSVPEDENDIASLFT